MSKPITIIWPVLDLAAVCANQTLAAPGSLIINGTLASNPNVPNLRAEFPKIARRVSLQSAGNLSGVNFTITGIGDNGYPKSVTIAGPNNSIVNTGASLFTIVNSVTVDAPVATNVQVGTGAVGATQWILSDHYRDVNHLSINVVVTGVVDYTFQTTYDDPTTNPNYVVKTPIDGVTIPTIPTATPMVHATVSCLADYTIPTRYSRIFMNSSDATGALEVNFLQQG
jgi:hypothetical protein